MDEWNNRINVKETENNMNRDVHCMRRHPQLNKSLVLFFFSSISRREKRCYKHHFGFLWGCYCCLMDESMLEHDLLDFFFFFISHSIRISCFHSKVFVLVFFFMSCFQHNSNTKH